MNKYQSYKQSGVEWIGEIPSTWDTPRLKYLISESFGGEVIDKSYWGDGDEVLYTTSKTVHKSNYHSFNDERRTTTDDLLLSRNGDGIVHIPPKGCIYTNVVQLVRIKNGLNRRFLWYSLTHQIKPLNSFSDGDFIVSLNKEQWFNLLTPHPSLNEQNEIVEFLDSKTELIDKLISTKERKIILLKEKSTSLINQIVTKGLNPNVKMKESDVECIGEIPKHWEVPSLNKISNITRLAGYEYTSYWEEDENGEIKVLRGQNIGFGKINEKDTDRISNDLSMRLIRSRLFKNDLVFPCVGTIGNCVVIENDNEYHINQNIAKITPIEIIDSYFLCYYLLSYSTKFQIKFYNTSEVQPSVLVGSLRRFKICLPPILEQRQIVSYLDKQTQLIDKTISIEERKIELLKQYRQSLISEVVTGKIKVTTD